jgi:hypothetical protein
MITPPASANFRISAASLTDNTHGLVVRVIHQVTGTVASGEIVWMGAIWRYTQK